MNDNQLVNPQTYFKEQALIGWANKCIDEYYKCIDKDEYAMKVKETITRDFNV
jgi:hypothetical protein|tara:strand:+ start:46 stop:204 length:159 start_codon:yes stop_codon:yes gene_type:complete